MINEAKWYSIYTINIIWQYENGCCIHQRLTIRCGTDEIQKHGNQKENAL